MTASGDRVAAPRDVLCFTDSAIAGGAEHALMTLLAGLDRRIWTPVLVHHDHDGLAPVVAMAERAGIARWMVPPMPEGMGGARAGVRFARQLRRRRPAVFHAHMSWPLACKWPLIAAVTARIPAVLGTVQLFVDVPMGPSRRLQTRPLGSAVGRFLAVSEDTRRRLLSLFRWPADAVRVVHNAVDIHRFTGPPDPTLRAQLDDGTGRPLALVPARLDPQKGHEHLLRAARALPHIRFLLAGDGPLRAELENRARGLGVEERITFLGRREDMPALLATCDLVVLPSLYEGLPLSLIEAMAARRPIVATDIGGTRELIDHGQTGLLVPPQDAEALAEAIRGLVVDPALSRRLGSAGRDRAIADFSSEAMVASVSREYSELLDG